MEQVVVKEIVASLDQLDSVVKYLDNTLPGSCVVFLRGDLAFPGAGCRVASFR